MSDQPDQRAFKLTHVRANIRSNEQRYVGGKRDPLLLALFLQDGDLSFKIRRLNVGDQAPLEATAKSVFNFGKFLWRTIAGDHDLLHGLMQRIESMEELFLGAFLLGQELNIVDEQNVHIAK